MIKELRLRICGDNIYYKQNVDTTYLLDNSIYTIIEEFKVTIDSNILDKFTELMVNDNKGLYYKNNCIASLPFIYDGVEINTLKDVEKYLYEINDELKLEDHIITFNNFVAERRFYKTELTTSYIYPLLADYMQAAIMQGYNIEYELLFIDSYLNKKVYLEKPYDLVALESSLKEKLGFEGLNYFDNLISKIVEKISEVDKLVYSVKIEFRIIKRKPVFHVKIYDTPSMRRLELYKMMKE